jgi:soluble lytic murein transglycosylase-like protein
MSNKILLPVLVASIVVLLGLSLFFYGKWQNIEKSYLEELKQLSTENTELKEQIVTLTKGNKNIVPIINKLRPQLDHKIVGEISEAIVKYSREYRFPPEFVTHLIHRESAFNVLAVSNKGAVGLMQVLPKYHEDKMKKLGINSSQLFHIDNNVKLGCWILRDYYNNTGSIEKALTKYVGGSHNGYINDILTGFTNETIPRTNEHQKKGE